MCTLYICIIYMHYIYACVHSLLCKSDYNALFVRLIFQLSALDFIITWTFCVYMLSSFSKSAILDVFYHHDTFQVGRACEGAGDHDGGDHHRQLHGELLFVGSCCTAACSAVVVTRWSLHVIVTRRCRNDITENIYRQAIAFRITGIVQNYQKLLIKQWALSWLILLLDIYMICLL